MLNFQPPKSHIHVIARGLLMHGDDIVLCRPKDAKWFFLPGGHVEDGESAREALLRELHEEMGDSDYKVTSFIGVCENIFQLQEGTQQHEINIIFQVNIPHELKIDSKEDRIEFVNVKGTTLKDHNILPVALKNGLLEWLESAEPFLKEI